MFTGLVEELGTVRAVRARGAYRRIAIDAEKVLDDLAIGDSVSVDGACQTVVGLAGRGFEIDTLAETIRKTTLGDLTVGRRVNLERALRVGDRLGGHIVQGHVDGVGTIRHVEVEDLNVYVEVALPAELLRYCIGEGSIAVNGVSLTIAELRGTAVRLNIIPETWRRTTLRECGPSAPVNIEVDVLARHVERLLAHPAATTGAAAAGAGAGAAADGAASHLSPQTLASWGYGG